MMGELKTWLEALGDLVFPKPPVCMVCNASIHKSHFIDYPLDPPKIDSSTIKFIEKTRVDVADQVCPACYRGLELIVAPFCQKCGRTMAISAIFCQDCNQSHSQQTNHKTRAFQYARAATTYNETMQEMISLFKYKGRRDLANPLSIILCNAFEQHYNNIPIDIIVPVPLHVDRLAERGFNQAVHISKHISDKRGIPIIEVLKRTQYTEKQSKKTKAERTLPLEHVFEINSKLEKKSILLVDDIYTTGTTIDACAKVLMNSGAKDVYALTLAR